MSYRILIVDDTKFLRLMLTDLLVKAGHDVVGSAENGIVGVEKYRELRPDLVIMDITMPDMDGITALKEIKTIEADAVVLICSAMSQRDLISKALKAGANNYIMKPFEPERVNEVILEVSPLIEKRKAEQAKAQNSEAEATATADSDPDIEKTEATDHRSQNEAVEDAAIAESRAAAESDVSRNAHLANASNAAVETDQSAVSGETVDGSSEAGRYSADAEVAGVADDSELPNAPGETPNASGEAELNNAIGEARSKGEQDNSQETRDGAIKPFSTASPQQEERKGNSEFGSLLGHNEIDGLERVEAQRPRHDDKWSDRDVEADLAALLSQMEAEAAAAAEIANQQHANVGMEAEVIVAVDELTDTVEASSDTHETVDEVDDNEHAASVIEETHDPDAYMYVPSEAERNSKEPETKEGTSADSVQIELKRKRMSNIASSIMCRWSEKIDDKEINFIIVYNEYDKSLRIDTISPDEQRNGITMSLDGFTFLRDWLEQKGVQFERFI